MDNKTISHNEVRRVPVIHGAAQTGQAIVLVAITMVLLLASIGLAIDGGNAYLAYRNVQNAVDSAALTAAFTACTDGDAVAAAERSLRINGVDDTMAGVVMEVNRPPVRNTAYTTDEYIEVYAEITNPSYFIQIVNPQPIVVNASAISRCNGGSSTAITNDVVNRYAFRSLAGAGECTQTTSWNIAGTRWTLEGDIWMPNISGNVQLNNNQPNPETEDNPIDILGNIYIGQSESARFNDRHASGSSQGLNEDVASSAATSTIPGYTGHAGDGQIDYNVPEPDPLPYTMDYFRPEGSSLCAPGSTECGGLQRRYPSAYHDISYACDHGAVNKQDFSQNAATFGNHYNTSTREWNPGIYYSECDLQLNENNMSGEVSFITEGAIDLSNQPYNMVSFGDAPLFVSNKDNRRGNVQQCSAGGSYAIQLNANNSYFRGPIIAFEGTVFIQGNGFVMETCISAMGFAQNGNTSAIYRCLPGESISTLEYGLIE